MTRPNRVVLVKVKTIPRQANRRLQFTESEPRREASSLRRSGQSQWPLTNQEIQ